MRETWTPEQFWEFAEGLTDDFVSSQLRDMMTERGLILSNGIAQTMPVRGKSELYRTALAALQAAHYACFKHPERDLLGMSNGPFSGVNVALGIISQLETENIDLRAAQSSGNCSEDDALNAALCNYLNQIGDRFEPKEQWQEFCWRGFSRLNEAYNNWYRVRKPSLVPSTYQSAPAVNGSLPSGESDPSVTLDCAGAGTALIEALRPFAYYFDLNDCEGRSDGDALEMPVSDLRAARNLLKSLGIDTTVPPWASAVTSTTRDAP